MTLLLSKRLRAIGVIDEFLAKLDRQNEALQSFSRTAEFSGFKKAMADAIAKQAAHVGRELVKVNDWAIIRDDLNPMTSEQKGMLRDWVAKTLPAITDYVSPEDVAPVLQAAFEEAVKASYRRMGVLVKADTVDFELTNQAYIDALHDQANYLLNLSTLYNTTVGELADFIAAGKENGLTIDELGAELASNYDEISAVRGLLIARTETAQAMGKGNLASMTENGVSTKHWVIAGPHHHDDECNDNADDGDVPVNQAYSSGAMHVPAHPNCECYDEAGEVDLDSIDIWSGD